MSGKCRRDWERGAGSEGLIHRPSPQPPPTVTPSSLAHSLHHCVPARCEVVFVAIDEGHPEVEEQIDKKGSCILCQEDLGGWGQVSRPNVANGRRLLIIGSGLTVTQLIWAPRSRKYSVAVVPTGSFCRTSSSFRDLPSTERQAMLRSYPGLRPLPPGCPGVVK